MNRKDRILHKDQQARVALRKFSDLSESSSRTLFICDDDEIMVGSLTDGDIRRGLLNDLEISQPIHFFMNTNFKCIKKGEFDKIKSIKSLRDSDIFLVPLLSNENRIVDILNLREVKSLIPASVLIMAGGRGIRLKPFTDNVPKPMLLVGGKPIIEHNIDRLVSYGIKEFFISVNYLKDSIKDYFGDGSSKGIKITYIEENEPLGTIGSISLMDQIENEDLIVMNSDILTNLNFEEFYEFYCKEKSSMIVASVPYEVNIPYAVLETNKNVITSFSEKPKYTYYSNAGIYIIKFSLKRSIKKNTFFDATQLMESLLLSKTPLNHFPILNYWLDIGRHQDYVKAQQDINHINFN